MGYETPNIDSIADEGMMFTDYYAEQSCTAGRSTFITGQSTLRTGLSKVGLPGADLGLKEVDVTIASALKDLGYATGPRGCPVWPAAQAICRRLLGWLWALGAPANARARSCTRCSGFDGGSGRQSPQAARSAIFASSPSRKPAIAPIPVSSRSAAASA